MDAHGFLGRLLPTSRPPSSTRARFPLPLTTTAPHPRWKALRWLALSCVLAPPAPLPAQSIVTVAGGGSDDGRLATTVTLSAPYAAAVDSSGNLFIADWGKHLIRESTDEPGLSLPPRGTAPRASPETAGRPRPRGSSGLREWWSTPRGPSSSPTSGTTGSGGSTRGPGSSRRWRDRGLQGFSGDGGPATAAALDNPTEAGLDRPETSSSRTTTIIGSAGSTAGTGIITTVAGKPPKGSRDGGPATAASLSYPTPWRWTLPGTSTSRTPKTTWSGGSPPGQGSSPPWPAQAAQVTPGMAVRRRRRRSQSLRGDVDPAGNLYVADYGNHRIRRIAAGTGVITTVAGTGTQGYSGDGDRPWLQSSSIPRASCSTVGGPRHHGQPQ